MRFMNKILALGFLLFLISTNLKGQDTLYLDDAIQIGLKNNFSIIVAQNNLQIATNNSSMGNAGMLPKVDANAAQNNISQDIKRKDSGTTTEYNNKAASMTGALQLNWTLFDGFNMFVLREQNRNLQQMGNLQLRMTIEDATASIIINYYGIALQQKLLKSLKESFVLSKNRLMIAKEKTKIGAGYELQVIQAEIDFQTDSSSILRQENLIKNQMIALNRLLGRNANTSFSIKDIQPSFAKPDYNAIVEGLNSQNAELLYERMNVSNKELSIRSLKTSRMPRIAFVSSYNFSSIGNSTSSPENSRTFGPSVGVTASITLFNGFNLSRNIKNAQLQAQNQRVMLTQTENLLQSNLSQSYNDLELALALIRTEETIMKLATKNVSVALEKYRLGAISDLELRDVQKKMLDAQYRFFSAQLQAKTAEIDLKILAGVLLNEISTDKP
ncbi:MAG: TolC family protein [Bacteroidales bacterium]|nr:MAG: TolC family protein [Bacteroidales bacterium]